MKTVVICGSKKGKTRHCIDSSKYKTVSRAKALCGKSGKDLIYYDAVFFNYRLMYPTMCKKCQALLDLMPEVQPEITFSSSWEK